MKFLGKLLSAFLFVIFFTLFPSGATAQDDDASANTPFDTAFAEYQSQLEAYQKAHADYILKRTQYLRFKTLESQTAAQEATVAMMQERDDVIISYLKMLKERLAEADGVDDVKESNLAVRIDAELNYFETHRDRIPSAGSLRDLEEDNRLARQRFLSTEPLFYQSLATVSYGQLLDYDQRLTDIYVELQNKISEIKAESREEYQLSSDKIAQLDRWVIEAGNRIERAREKEAEGETGLESLIAAAQRRQPPLNLYNTALLRLVEGQTLLKEAGNFMREIIREIKSKN